FWAANIGHTECVKLLIDAGADVNRANNEGRTPLSIAEKNGHTECAELLRAAGGTTGGIGGFFKRLFS
ncbi:MAG: ankyrin repeat domain-containing protein, partial [Akkermansia sp.]|nr:ankyrin repeat domain-containing protein [Akkermansia sp.]